MLMCRWNQRMRSRLSHREPYLLWCRGLLGHRVAMSSIWLAVNTSRRGTIHTGACHWALLLLRRLTIRSTRGLTVSSSWRLAVRHTCRLSISTSRGSTICSPGCGRSAIHAGRIRLLHWSTTLLSRCSILVTILGKLDGISDSMLSAVQQSELDYHNDILFFHGLSGSARSHARRQSNPLQMQLFTHLMIERSKMRTLPYVTPSAPTTRSAV